MKSPTISSNATALEKCEAYFNTINHMIISTITIYITYFCWNLGPTSGSLHIWLCTIGVSFKKEVKQLLIIYNFFLVYTIDV